MRRILIIEDDPIIQTIYTNKYSSAGFEVLSAKDGDAGWRIITESRPDLVQLDLLLPKLGGNEIIRLMRSHPDLKKIPILVLSNEYATDATADAWRAGATQCFSKLNTVPRQLVETARMLLNEGSAGFGGTSPGAAETAPSFEDLLREARGHHTRISHQLHAVMKTSYAPGAGPDWNDLCLSTRSLASMSGLQGWHRISHLSGAMEVLLRELQDKPPENISSSLRTLAQAVDCLKTQLDNKSPGPEEFRLSAMIMAVDDDFISRQTLASALAKVQLRALGLDDPELALKVLSLNKFDIIFLDLEMPGMDGFELCSKIRALPAHRVTPVVFVTSYSDFQTRARSALSGGTDFIEKPFPLIELGLKALTMLLKPHPRAK